jgi:hypothetical protein
MDPNRRDAMRQSFTQVVKQMDPIDALVLKAAYTSAARAEWVLWPKHRDPLDAFGKLLMNAVSG